MIIYTPHNCGDLKIGLKGQNVLVTKDNCMQLLGWTEEQYNKFTIYAPYPVMLGDKDGEEEKDGKS